MHSSIQNLTRLFDLKINQGEECAQKLSSQQFQPLSYNFGLPNKFPDELLLFIFQFLSIHDRICLRRVSIRWSNVLSEIPKLEISFISNLYCKQVYEEWCKKDKLYFIEVSRIWSNLPNKQIEILNFLIKTFCNLRKFVLDCGLSSEFSNEQIWYSLIERNPNITFLNILVIW